MFKRSIVAVMCFSVSVAWAESAVVTASDGFFEVVTGVSTTSEAERLAMGACKDTSSKPNSCKVLTSMGGSFCAVIITTPKNDHVITVFEHVSKSTLALREKSLNGDWSWCDTRSMNINER
jgi:hypothetical protein